ncbi:hypothetical protein FACS189490_01860 [Clostridia bacterium]|nr:hypothetical protein FACS189490_01860 [Clostridia bacterium]
MRIVILVLAVILNFIVQSSFFPIIEIFGAKPNTALIIVVCAAIFREEITGALVGFFAGLLYDVFFGRYIGFCALQLCLIGYFCGKPYRDFFKSNLLIPLTLVFVSVAFYNLSYYVAHFLLLARTDFLHYVKQIIFPETAYTLAVTIPLYGLAYLVNKGLDAFEWKRRKMFE